MNIRYVLKQRLALFLILAAIIIGCGGGGGGGGDTSSDSDTNDGGTSGASENESPIAFIDSIAPNLVIEGNAVTFSGHGTDSDGTIAAYRWVSSIDGPIGASAQFSRGDLSVGLHTISLTVTDDDGADSTAATQQLTVQEAPPQPAGIIIDNGDDATSSTSTWAVSDAAGAYGADSLWSRDGATYSWHFTPPTTAYYEVSMWWTTWSSRGTSIPVAIAHAGGTSTVYIDQQANGGQFNPLGIFQFTAGTSYTVTITALPDPASTCADAVRFVETTPPVPTAPVAAFTADRTTAGENSAIQFRDQSTGNVQQWLWNFGDGATSTQQNPTHSYADAGHYTVRLTVSNSVGSDTITRLNYITIAARAENIYICDGYSHDALLVPWCETQLRNLGATEQNGVWQYTNADRGITYYIRFVRTAEGMLAALREEGAHVIYNGHSNYGLGAVFADSEEIANQSIPDIRYVDDPRILNISTDMVSVKIDGMQSGQAYPNWLPIFSNGSSAIMPYDFSEGLPPYNYYLTYSPPGDSAVYKVELADGSYLERFPDSRVPPWDFSVNPLPPHPVANPEYFITNPGDEFNHCEYTGEWTMGGDCKDDDAECMGYNYHYSSPGSGADIATWYFVVAYPGYYTVEASWESAAANASNAKYTIHHSAGSTTVEANQRVNSATGFNTLGEYYFEAGIVSVQVNDDANGTVIADAVQLIPADNPEDLLEADFTTDVRSGSAPLAVTFRSRSYAANPIASYYWNFGDGTTSTEQNPVHTYASSGIYTVTLRVTDSISQQATETKESLIAVGTVAPVHAEFSARGFVATAGTTARFTDQSSGDITSWHWDFGDGTSSASQSPSHTYSATGTYTVTLSVSGPGGNDTETESMTILYPSSYTDNSYQYKAHFVSWGDANSTFGKVILDAGLATVPTEDFRYARLFYASCNSGNYYIGKFHRGIMFFTISDQTEYNAHHYLRNYLLGWSDEAILNDLNSRLDIYEYFDFNQPPPSLR